MVRGYLDFISNYKIKGWAFDELVPEARLELDIIVDDALVGSVVASAFRADLQRAGIGDGNHGFQFLFLQPLSPLRQHVIRVSTKHERHDLKNSPAILELSATAPSQGSENPESPKEQRPREGGIRGWLEAVNMHWITGWAAESLRPEAPVSLLVTDNDILLGRVLANQFRKDLKEAGIGSGRHAFKLLLPDGLSPLERHEIRVRRESDGIDLRGSPVVIEPTRFLCTERSKS